MTDLLTYFVDPPTEADALVCHFGEQGIGVEASSPTWSSDSLFAALVATAATTSPPTDLARLVSAAEDGTLRHSSLLPRIGDVVLLPRPALQLNVAHADLLGKAAKKVRWLSSTLFNRVCAGEQLDLSDIVMVQGKTIWMTRAEVRPLQDHPAFAPTRRTPGGENDDQWFNRFQGLTFWSIQSRPHVALDRVNNASAYYEVGAVQYRRGCGLALLVHCPDSRVQQHLDQLLAQLGDSGIGGKRSMGYGACRFKRQPEAVAMPRIPPQQRPTHYVVLSRYIPQPDEIGLMVNPVSAYNLVTVGGYVYSPAYPSTRRNTVTMLTEGSVLAFTEQAPPQGVLADVRPADSTIPHPIYRSGLALAVPIAHHPPTTATSPETTTAQTVPPQDVTATMSTAPTPAAVAPPATHPATAPTPQTNHPAATQPQRRDKRRKNKNKKR